MERLNLLIVKHGADWSKWAAMRPQPGNLMVLVQQPDEPASAFQQRISQRISGLKNQQIGSMLLVPPERPQVEACEPGV